MFKTHLQEMQQKSSLRHSSVMDGFLGRRHAATCPCRLCAWYPAIQRIHDCAMKGLDQALTAGTSVGLPKPAKYVKVDCGRANSSSQVRKDKHLPQLLGRKDILGKRSLVLLLLSHSHGWHVHAFHTDRLRSSLWPATRMPQILLRCSIRAKLDLR